MQVSPLKLTASAVIVAAVAAFATVTIHKRGTAKPSAAITTPIPLTGEQLCERDLKKFVIFKNPDNMQINSVEPNAMREGRYWISVSAKNNSGGYNIPINCSCSVNAKTATVSGIQCKGDNYVSRTLPGQP